MPTPSSPETLLSPFPRIRLCRTFWNGANFRGPPQYQLAKGHSSWPGERCPTRAASTQWNSVPTPSANLPINLPSPENVLVLWVELFSCLPYSSRGVGSLSDAPERSYLLRSNPGLWGQVLKTKGTPWRPLSSTISEWRPQALPAVLKGALSRTPAPWWRRHSLCLWLALATAPSLCSSYCRYNFCRKLGHRYR